MKSIIKKLGIALALAASCILAAPVAPVGAVGAVPETNLETGADLVRGHEVNGAILCTKQPCPIRPNGPGPVYCCNIIIVH